MIVFLTLCYVGVLAVAIKTGLVPLNLWWKMSPLVWMLLLFVVLFLPMQWGAPGGAVNVFQYVVEVVPNVSGEVIEVPVKPLEPLRRDDVLFRIDPVPFQAQVDQLEAQLAGTIQNVDRLKASAEAAEATVRQTEDEIDVKKAEVDAAVANVAVAEATKDQAETNLVKASELVDELGVQVAAAGRELERQNELLAQNAGSESDVDRAKVRNSNLVSQLNSAEADLRSAEQNLTGSRASLEVQKANSHAAELQLKQLIDAELPRARAVAKEATLAAESMIGGEHTSVADVRAQLASAQYDLDQTVVRAPSAGHVTFATLRPGQRVASLPMRSWMAFVDHERIEVAVAIEQYALRKVRPGQEVEVTFKVLPGRIFSGTVNRIAYSASSGQLQPSGQLASFGSAEVPTEPYGVVVDINDDAFDSAQLPGGASGSAAIYTESMKPTHVIRRVMIRMDAWMNYILP